MLQGVDINQVKQYNTSLKQYRDKAANINAQIEFTQKELDTICKELSAELGVEVNESNIEQIYNEQVEKINATLKSGNTVLAKIAEEEQKIVTGQVVNQTVNQTATPVQATPVAPIVPPSNAAPVVDSQPVLDSDAVAGSVFGNGQANTSMGTFNGLGPMFKLGG